jgi:acyl dehydratase
MHFRDLTPGRVIVGGRHTVTEEEIVEFARRYDPQWFHTDPERARSGRWEGLIASGWMTCSIAMRLAVTAVLAGSESIGSPGIEQIKWPAPVRPGDELQLRIEVLESRVSRSGSIGIVRWRWLLSTAPGVTVLEMVATSLFELSGAGATS